MLGIYKGNLNCCNEIMFTVGQKASTLVVILQDFLTLSSVAIL